MSFLNNKQKRSAAVGTFLVHLALFFVFYSFGLQYMDPKVEEGIAIEFGYDDSGMGEDVTQSEEVVTEILEQVKTIEETTVEELNEITEEVVTQELEEAPSITEKPESEKKQEITPELIEEEKPKASEELQQALSSLFQSNTTTEAGDTDTLGAQGNLPFEMPAKYKNISAILPPSVQKENWIHDEEPLNKRPPTPPRW